MKEKIDNRLNICVTLGWDIAEPEVRATLAEEIIEDIQAEIEGERGRYTVGCKEWEALNNLLARLSNGHDRKV